MDLESRELARCGELNYLVGGRGEGLQRLEKMRRCKSQGSAKPARHAYATQEPAVPHQ
jgi:hypothetical protein